MTLPLVEIKIYTLKLSQISLCIYEISDKICNFKHLFMKLQLDISEKNLTQENIRMSKYFVHLCRNFFNWTSCAHLKSAWMELKFYGRVFLMPTSRVSICLVYQTILQLWQIIFSSERQRWSMPLTVLQEKEGKRLNDSEDMLLDWF